MKRKKRKLLVILILCALLIAGILLLPGLRFPAFSPAAFTESDAWLANPYIGWYEMHGYQLSDQAAPDLSQVPDKKQAPGLVLLEINLSQYADAPISDTGLGQLDEILAAWQAAGKQLILRFLYDWDGNARDAEPKELSLILEHMTQTMETVNRYADCVYLLQGIFVGNWGEMHSSDYLSEEDMVTLTLHLAQITDPAIFLAVRTPEQWRTITGLSQPPIAGDTAFDSTSESLVTEESVTDATTAGNAASSSPAETLALRLGLYNDGMMGSETDLGTYASPEEAQDTPYARRSLPEEVRFQDALCLLVPNGGEAAGGDTPYNDIDAAVSYLSSIHASYLNGSYDEAVLSKWKEQVYDTGDSGNVFHGMNGYGYIARHLGYRYVLRSADFACPSPAAENGLFTLSLENVGFSNAYRSFDVSLILRHQVSRQEHVLPIQTDTRLWSPGTEVSLEIPVSVSSLSPGAYEIMLQIIDPASGAEIQLANEGAGAQDRNSVGTLSVSIFPQ